MLVAGCGEDGDDQTTASTQTTGPAPTTTTAEDHGGGPKDEGGGDGGPEPAKLARDAVRHYIGAIDARDGSSVCSILVPGALDGVSLPEAGPDCAASVSASIGHHEPRSLPPWQTSKILGFRAVRVHGHQARVTVTVRTIYRGRADEPSIEDDVIYLAERQGDWLLVKPSVTFYRAIGEPEVPPQVLAPPE